MNLRGQNVLVLGLGESGLAMAKWLTRQGALLRVADSRVTPPNLAVLRAAAPHAELRLGEFDAHTFVGVDLIAISPGIPVAAPFLQTAVLRGVPLVSEIELFAWAVRAHAPQSKMIAISGSNGKTTTTTLVAHLLNAVGVFAVACGNISPAALDALMHAQDTGQWPKVWVLELSSFQLETTYSLNADAAALLNVSEDHLDRYSGMAAYAAAKARVFQGADTCVQNRDDPAFLPAESIPAKTASFGLRAPVRANDYGLRDGWIVRGQESLIALGALKIAGTHNAANAMAALALCEAIGIAPFSLCPALTQFSGLAHRVEWVATIKGVAFYDDSKGTNVGATLAAVQGMGCQVAIILGGEGKGQDFSPLKAALRAHARLVVLIGRDAALIAEAIGTDELPVRFCTDLPDAVRACAAAAQPGDAVLLSPACASFDMFRDYAHRAEVFVAAVHELAKEHG